MPNIDNVRVIEAVDDHDCSYCGAIAEYGVTHSTHAFIYTPALWLCGECLKDYLDKAFRKGER